MTRRGQTGGLAIALLFIGLIVAAGVSIMLQPANDIVHNKATNATTNQTALDGVSYTWSMIENSALIVTLVSVFGLGVLALFERRGI